MFIGHISFQDGELFYHTLSEKRQSSCGNSCRYVRHAISRHLTQGVRHERRKKKFGGFPPRQILYFLVAFKAAEPKATPEGSRQSTMAMLLAQSKNPRASQEKPSLLSKTLPTQIPTSSFNEPDRHHPKGWVARSFFLALHFWRLAPAVIADGSRCIFN